MKKLNDLIPCNYNIPIKGIKIDSRRVEKGDLFVAIKGYNIDHNIFIDDAIKNGAVAIITTQNQKKSIPVIKVKNINQTLIDLCKKFYDYQDSLNLIGITGTDGKTTTATILQELLSEKENTAYIGTNGIKINNQYEQTENTTPSIESMYYYLSKLESLDYKNVVLEVSSEALLHKRVENLKFKYAIYTNITEDHLNIHKTVDNYIQAKNQLVNLVNKKGIIIINGDDKNCQKLTINEGQKVITYGKRKDNDFIIDTIKEQEEITSFQLKTKENVYEFKSQLQGEYNIYNLTAAIIVCLLEKIPLKILQEKIEKLKTIPGRRENLSFGQKYTIILDYAHTENGIKTIVESLKKKNRNITVVTGSAGGREVEKRGKIGSYLLNNVKQVIFTMDDPRYENVDDIIDQMIGTEQKTNYKRIIDREKAICFALNNAKENDIVLILGKGRDHYMAIEDRKEEYSDYNVIKNYFQKEIKKD